MSAATREHEITAGSEMRAAASVVRAFYNVLRSPRAFAKAAALPGLVIFAIIYGFSLITWTTFYLAPFALCVLALPLSVLGLSWLRISLQGTPPRLLSAKPWSRAAALTLAYTLPWIVWSLATPALMQAMFEFYVATRPGIEPSLIAGVCHISLGLYLMSRLMLATPAIAVNMDARPAAAWRLANDKSLRIFGGLYLLVIITLVGSFVCFFVFAVLIEVLAGLFEPAIYPLWQYWWLPSKIQVVITIALSFGAAALAEYLALVFKALTGWRGSQREILERFE